MTLFTVYNSAGTILRSGRCPAKFFEMQALGDDEFVIEGNFPNNKYRMDMSDPDNPKPVELVPDPVPLGELKDRAHRKIDNTAGDARRRYITTVPGQAETYLEKVDDARSYLADGSPADLTDYPWIEIEAEVTGSTPTEAAEMILRKRREFTFIGKRIERLRRSGKLAVDKARTESKIQSILDSTLQQLAEI